MPLTLRSTGLSSPAYADKLDYVVCEDGKVIGRLYEDATRSPIFVGSGPSRCTSTQSSGRAGKAPTEWVSVFQREGGMRIYLAGPLFTSAERDFNAALAAGLRALGHEVWVPQESEQQQTTAKAIFDSDVRGIDWCEVVVACMDGADPDSGTCWEVGSVWRRKPTVLYRTDIRSESLPLGPYNLMLHQAADRILDCRWVSVGKIAEEIHAALGSL
jgi:nucleoside 2-deoxyribosyltransferase